MTTFSSSCKPLAFYADGEAPLEELVDKFGSRLEKLTVHDKLILLASIATNLAFHDGREANRLRHRDETGEEWSLLDTYHDLPSTAIGNELLSSLDSLDNLQRDSLLGLCEALVAQVRYTREVVS